MLHYPICEGAFKVPAPVLLTSGHRLWLKDSQIILTAFTGVWEGFLGSQYPSGPTFAAADKGAQLLRSGLSSGLVASHTWIPPDAFRAPTPSLVSPIR